MNLAIHGLEGDIREGISYYDDLHTATGQFDFVLANPPFNVNAVDKERLEGDVGTGRRFPFGLPRVDNANYLWIQLFYSTLSTQGRAGFVMANSASDARSSEQGLRRQLIEDRAVDVMVAVGPNMFYTVTLPVTLWFLDRGKKKTPRADKVLFLDARHIYRQIDRAHRNWAQGQIGFIANVVRLYRGEHLDFTLGGNEAQAKIQGVFGKKPKFADVLGLCKVATVKEIEAQGWSLNPGRPTTPRSRPTTASPGAASVRRTRTSPVRPSAARPSTGQETYQLSQVIVSSSRPVVAVTFWRRRRRRARPPRPVPTTAGATAPPAGGARPRPRPPAAPPSGPRPPAPGRSPAAA